MIASVFDDSDDFQFYQVCETRHRAPELDDALQWRLGPIELESKLAEQLKESHRYEVARQKEKQERERHAEGRLSPKEQIAELLQEAEAGNVDAWWRINLYLLEDEQGHRQEMQGNLTKSPGWIVAAPETRARLVAAARLYLSQENLSENEVNYSSGTLYRRPMAGYRALRLLQQEDPGSFQDLTPERWVIWAPAVLYFLDFPGDDEPKAKKELLARAYSISTEAVRTEIAKVLSAHGAKTPASTPFFLHSIEDALDHSMAELLWELLSRIDPFSGPGEHIFRLLVKRGFSLAVEKSRALLHEGSLAPEESWPYAIKVAHWLLEEAADCGWSIIEPTFRENPEFGRRFWKSVAEGRGVPKLSPNDLGQTYLWLVEAFPLSDESEDDPVFWLKSSFLNRIANSGTLEGCYLLDGIVQRLPGHEDLRWYLQQAWKKFREETFPWPTPKEFRAVVESEKVRWVRTEGELLETVYEALERLQQELQGKSPAAMDLWGKVSKQEFKPNEEPDLSSYVERFLNRDLKGRGVIAHREVQIRRRTSIEGSSGELLDILVTVREPVSREEINVVIEVKCSWNHGLLTDLNDQLVERYLRDFPGRSGIYLVGWFNCRQWMKSDPRQRVSAKFDLEPLKQNLTQQAEAISSSKDVRVRAFVLDAALR